MQNVSVKVTGNQIVITIDKTKRLGPSKTGKTTIVASSGGNLLVPGTDIYLGVNAYVK